MVNPGGKATLYVVFGFVLCVAIPLGTCYAQTCISHLKFLLFKIYENSYTVFELFCLQMSHQSKTDN